MFKKLLLFIFIITFSKTFLAQSQFGDFLNRVNSISDQTAKKTVVDSFYSFAQTKGIPFIEKNTANFIYRGNSNTVQVAGDFTGWNPSPNLTKLDGTDLFYGSANFEMNARLDYKFILNGGTWILDPANPHRVPGGFGANSELAMPEYVQPWEINYKANIKHGKIEQKSIHSNIVKANYQLRIYLPPDYDSSATTYPAVYFQDGNDYLNFASAQNIIDNLLDSNKIKPFVGIFVQPNNRNDEYAYGKRNLYAQFFVEELVHFIDSIYNTDPKPNNRLVLGDSFGGNISAIICYNHPDVFANCGQQSGAFWTNNNEVSNMLRLQEAKPIKIFSVWGTYADVSDDWRLIKDVLVTKGYQLKWIERPEGHSWGLWRATLDDLLQYFFPANSTSVKDINPEKVSFTLKQNYPNPFNPITTIEYTIPIQEANPGVFIQLKVYDIIGNEVTVLVNENQEPGNYRINFDGRKLSSGTYYYKLQAGDLVSIKKLILLK